MGGVGEANVGVVGDSLGMAICRRSLSRRLLR